MKTLGKISILFVVIVAFSAIASPAQNSTDKQTTSVDATRTDDEPVTVKASTVVACSVAFRTVDSLRAELAVADETINRLRRLRTDLDANFEATLKAKDAEIAELRKALIEIVKNSSRRSKICLIC